MVVYRCEDSLESIFTAVYQAYEEKRNHGETLLSLSDDPILFAEDIQVIPCVEKVLKVMRTLKSRFGEKDYFSLCLALASEDSEKAQAVYKTIVDGLAGKRGRGHLFDNLANDFVHKSFSLARGAEREYAHLRGFVRFEELENGVLYSRVAPKNNVVTFLMPHFADRLPIENFVIYDEGRNFFGIHPAGKQWYLLLGEGSEMPGLKLSEEERTYRELFCRFCHEIAIKERKNLKLQRNMLPLRFQEYMVEFQQNL